MSLLDRANMNYLVRSVIETFLTSRYEMHRFVWKGKVIKLQIDQISYWVYLIEVNTKIQNTYQQMISRHSKYRNEVSSN